jgi:chromosome segregation ATPase
MLLKAQGEEHAKQIEEIIEQLNDIEVKYQADISRLQESLSDKTTMIQALHATLDEIRTSNNRLMDENSQHLMKISTLKQDYESSVQNCKDLECSLQNAKQDLSNIRLQQERLISEAVILAQEEIRAEADRQFAHANKMFLQLKKDYSTAVEERQMWMKRSEETMASVQNATQTFQSRMETLNYQLESTKTELEMSKMEHGKVRQQLQADSVLFAERMEEMRRDVVRMDRECAEAHQLVGTAVREKERLRKEVQELKAVCEELVSMVEGGEDR